MWNLSHSRASYMDLRECKLSGLVTEASCNNDPESVGNWCKGDELYVLSEYIDHLMSVKSS
jgi:hypothetical protein